MLERIIEIKFSQTINFRGMPKITICNSYFMRGIYLVVWSHTKVIGEYRSLSGQIYLELRNHIISNFDLNLLISVNLLENVAIYEIFS